MEELTTAFYAEMLSLLIYRWLMDFNENHKENLLMCLAEFLLIDILSY